MPLEGSSPSNRKDPVVKEVDISTQDCIMYNIKRLKYLGDNRRRTSFTFDDNNIGDVVIVVETSCNDLGVIKHNTISIPIEQLERFVSEYKTITDTVKFAGLA